MGSRTLFSIATGVALVTVAAVTQAWCSGPSTKPLSGILDRVADLERRTSDLEAQNTGLLTRLARAESEAQRLATRLQTVDTALVNKVTVGEEVRVQPVALGDWVLDVNAGLAREGQAVDIAVPNGGVAQKWVIRRPRDGGR